MRAGNIVQQQHGYSATMPQFEAICGKKNSWSGSNTKDFSTIKVQGQWAEVALSSLFENQYLLVDFSNTLCAGCTTSAKQHNTLLQERSEKGDCSFVTFLSPWSLGACYEVLRL
jgi:hypothetical protein